MSRKRWDPRILSTVHGYTIVGKSPAEIAEALGRELPGVDLPKLRTIQEMVQRWAADPSGSTRLACPVAGCDRKHNRSSKRYEEHQLLARAMMQEASETLSAWQRPSPTVEVPAVREGQVPLLLKPEEAARLLNIGRTKVYTLIARHELPSVRVGASVRIPREALAAWIRANTVWEHPEE